MPQQFKLIQKDNPQVSYQTTQGTFSLGRSRDCEITIEDNHISRVQAEVRSAKNRYVIKNIGRNPLLVNGSPCPERYLKDGDVITLGKISFVLQTQKSAEPDTPVTTPEEQTVVVTTPVQEEAAGCRLMIAAADGETKAVPIDQEKLVLGRSSEADVQLNDPLISRRHCVIERRAEGMFARNVSATNPLIVNGEAISENRLYSGDRLQLGSYSVVFISNLPDDIGQFDDSEALIAPKNYRAWGLTILLLLIIGSYFGYDKAYRPWRVESTFAAVQRNIDVGQLTHAKQTLKDLLTEGLSKEQTQQARQMLAKAALGVAEEKNAAGDVQGAKKSLSVHLSNYGSGPEAETLWDRMDFYCVALGKKLETQGETQEALRQYAAVRDGSLYQMEAQKAISRIWLNFQYQQRQQQTIVQLLKEGETHFAAKRYLTPVNRNAYAVYQAVLVLDPNHVLALKRIDQIKLYYRENGEHHFKNKKWPAALRYFERYRIIDPDDKDVAAKIETCRRGQAKTGTRNAASAPDKTGRTQSKPDTQRQEIQSLLESSGTESAWIMKYLFEEQKGEAETETPW